MHTSDSSKEHRRLELLTKYKLLYLNWNKMLKGKQSSLCDLCNIIKNWNYAPLQG